MLDPIKNLTFVSVQNRRHFNMWKTKTSSQKLDHVDQSTPGFRGIGVIKRVNTF